MNYVEIGLALFSLLISGICTVLWQKINKIEATAEKAANDLADFKLYVAKEHPTQDHLSKAIDGFNESIKEMTKGLTEIRSDIQKMSETFRDKLEQKVDKGH
jgi:peptidoglycan hydrolase CwlO-like protein